ncbi:hypothetical protein H8S37_08305 [Mediterraneibacter sp. NSJ-55]|uniref:Uncharacterized protein n=1 Tax=Mediterraneibacter hominis TaxID=2763054 RepID=A0A923LIJ4_9FIRM|nr:hypothetical protein [Mediterraneibacter hominis]MBC5688925.1 hypothetical protein [Mediterraneibacter hominis]
MQVRMFFAMGYAFICITIFSAAAVLAQGTGLVRTGAFLACVCVLLAWEKKLRKEQKIPDMPKKKEWIGTAIWITVCAFCYFIPPVFLKDTGSWMCYFLIFLPAVAFLSSLSSGKKKEYKWEYPVIHMLFFGCCVPVYYNETASVYILAYGGISLAGMSIRYIWNLNIRRNKK